MPISPTPNVSSTTIPLTVQSQTPSFSDRPGSNDEGATPFQRGSSHRSAGGSQATRIRSLSPGRVISATLKELLKHLREVTGKLAGNIVYAKEGDVEINATNIRCPAKNIVTVTQRLPGQDAVIHNLHANEITFTTNATTTLSLTATQGKSKTYIAAQSPIPKKDDVDGFFACDKFLAKAIETGSGLFQFVSPSKTGAKGYISKRSIIGQLDAKIKEAQGKGLIIAGHYQVKNLSPMKINLQDGSTGFHDSHFILELEDRNLGSDAKDHPISIVLTQAQVNFDKKLLSAEGIREASELMNEHKLRAGAPETGPDAMVISHAGIGRNATLIVYREILGRIGNGSIADVAQLEKEVVALIEQGRTARGPQFVHSDEQIGELVEALQKILPNKEGLEEPCINPPLVVPTIKPPVEQKQKPLDNLVPTHSTTEPIESKRVVAAALSNLFQLQATPADGDCLFHALQGKYIAKHNQCELTKEGVDAVRNAVGDVIENDTDVSDARYAANWIHFNDELSKRNPAGLVLAKVDETVDNKRYATMVRVSGQYASDDEIMAWTKIKGHEGVTVVVFDVGDSPSIVTYSSRGGRTTQLIESIGTTPKEICNNIIAHHGAHFDRAFDLNSNSPEKYRVILRQNMHFQRIVGFRNSKERRIFAHQNKQQQVADLNTEQLVQDIAGKMPGGLFGEGNLDAAMALVSEREIREESR